MAKKLILSLELLNYNSIEQLSSERKKLLFSSLTDFFADLAQKLLCNHQIYSEVIQAEDYYWYVTFNWQQKGLLTSEEEQLASILRAGERLISKYKQQELAKDIAAELDLKLDIKPFKKENLASNQNEQLSTGTNSDCVYVTKDRLKEVIDQHLINIHLQPILDLTSSQVVGFEALARGPKGSLLYSAGDLFRTAGRYGLIKELELVCVEEAIKLFSYLPQSYWLSINVGPDLLRSSQLSRTLNSLSGSDLERTVLELTEHIPLTEMKQIKNVIDSYQQQGVRLALDDTGCGFANLDNIVQLNPAIVKLCLDIVTNLVHNEFLQQKMFDLRKQVVNLDGSLLGEGIEEERELESLKRLNIRYGQGYYFARPQPAEEVLTNY
ncbi:MAG: EAL domain-containing protein [Bacillota bacterium]